MRIRALACDYDGTIAEEGRVAEATAAALARVRASGRAVLLVTGRRLPDLLSVCPDAERLFDAIVAENGALLWLAARRETRTLGVPPEPRLIEALRRRGVPFDLGSSIVATEAAFAEAARAAIREAGAPRVLVFNKSSLMLLPHGVSKGTGLSAALAALGLPPEVVAGIGDAENDDAFLAVCGYRVAVADAVAALRARADHVTRASGAAGVIEFVEERVLPGYPSAS